MGRDPIFQRKILSLQYTVQRVFAVDMLTGIAIAVAALTASLSGRREFLDVAVGVALISFVATCAFAAFLERRR